MMLRIFIFSLIIAISDDSVPDFYFCVADTTQPPTPSGYPCTSPTKVTVDDFVYSGLSVPGKTTRSSNFLKSKVTNAFIEQFTALNGMGISLGRLDMAVGGVRTMHVHPRGHETFFVMEGTISAGFISCTNVVYYKTLNKGDFIVFPQGLIHFQINSGNSSAAALSAFSDSNLGIHVIDDALFSNSFPSHLIAKVTLLDEAQVKKLKGLIGGAN